MKRVLVDHLPKIGERVLLSEEEARHTVQVFRMRSLDPVEALDGNGLRAACQIVIEGKKTWIELRTGEKPQPGHPLEVMPITLEIAVIKGDAMDWVIEKSVELGASEFVPLLTAYTVVQTGRKTPAEFQERWQRIADQSLKQCGRTQKLIIHPPGPLTKRLQNHPSLPDNHSRWIANESLRQTAQPLLNVAQELRPLNANFLIGPEGGFSEAEHRLLESSGKTVSLGPLILRAETAAIYGLSVMSAVYQSSAQINARH